MEFNGQEDVEAAIADEQQAADSGVDDLGSDEMGAVDLPEDFQHDAAEKADIEQQQLVLDIFDEKKIQSPADHQQHGEKQHQAQEIAFGFKQHCGGQELEGQVHGLGHAAVNVVWEEDIQYKHAEK